MATVEVVREMLTSLQQQSAANLAELLQRQHEATAELMKDIIGRTGGTGQSRRSLDERYFRRLLPFEGVNQSWKDWSFQFKAAVKVASKDVAEIIDWIERQQGDVCVDEVILHTHGDEDNMKKLASELYDVLCMLLKGEPLLLLQGIVGMDGFKAWQKINQKYNPVTPAKALMTLIEAVTPTKVKALKDLPGAIEKWELKVYQLERDFGEKMSDKMKTAVLTSMCTPDIQDLIFQNAEMMKDFKMVRDKVRNLILNRITVGNGPSPMDIGMAEQDDHEHRVQDEDEGLLGAVGKGGPIVCFRCGGYGHRSHECPTPKGKGKGDGKFGKGFDKGNDKGGKNSKGGAKAGKSGGKGNWECWRCGQFGHRSFECPNEPKPVNSMEKQEDALGGLWLFGCIDVEKKDDCADIMILKGDWKEMPTESVNIGAWNGMITIDSGAGESVWPEKFIGNWDEVEQDGKETGFIAANGEKMSDKGKKRAKFGDPESRAIDFPVTNLIKPLASVFRIVQKGNKVVFTATGGFIENMTTGEQIALNIKNGTFVMDTKKGFHRQTTA